MTCIIRAPVLYYDPYHGNGRCGELLSCYLTFQEDVNMDKYVKGFIVMSIVYLGISSILGIVMLGSQNTLALKFVHSHLNMLGWVSMMIYGVGYHILPRFMGRALYSNRIGEIQFYLANIALVALLLFYTLNIYSPSDTYRMLMVSSGIAEVITIFLFFYNMLMTLLTKVEPPH